MDIHQAIIHALDGEAVLFLGSGFSVGAIKADTHTLNGAGTLAYDLQKECGIPETEMTTDLGQASEVFLKLKSEDELVDYLIKEFTVIDITSAQETIGAVRWKRIYTTNYDNVIELAYLKNKRSLKSVVLSQSVSTFKDKSDLCVHLNGRIDGLTIDKLDGEFKLTNKSYLTEEFRKSNWLTLFRLDLLAAKAIFFVGYSMQYDLDIQRLVSSLDNIQEKTFFIMRKDESLPNQILVKKFGDVYAEGTENFALCIEDVKRTYTPSPIKLTNFLCFRCHSNIKDPKEIKDSDVLKFLTEGEFDSTSVYYSTISPIDYKYCIHRTKLSRVCDAIENKETKNYLIHASLGNGKSVFIDALSSLLTARGYKIYHYLRFMASFASELEAICKESDKTIMVFENYSSCFENLKIFQQFRTNQVLILSERSFVNEANYDTICSMFGEFSCIDIDRLDDDEVNALVGLLTEYGFWTILRNSNENASFIIDKCNRYLRNVILQLLNSPDIIRRFKTIIDSVKSKKGYYESIIFLLIASVSQIRLGVEDLAEAIDIDQINSPRFRSDSIVREFVDFDSNSIKSKSSLLSQALLSQIFDTEIVVNTMIKVMKNLNDYGSSNEVAKEIIRRLMTFTTVQCILNERDPRHKYNLLRYYEAIKSMKSCRYNPHFWLQYAIVMLSERDYNRAKYYFDAAYKYGKRINNFDTYQIDNHYARYILENERQSGNSDTCMEAFKHAHSILMDSKHKKEVRFYPYKVARLYYPFYEKFFKSMKDYEKKEFLKSCRDMLSRLEWYVSYSNEGSKRKDVTDAKESIQLILKETGQDESGSLLTQKS